MSGEQPETLLGHFPFLKEVPVHTLHSILTGLILSAISIYIFLRLKYSEDYTMPDEKPSIKGFFEMVTEFFYNILTGILGEEGGKYAPFVTSIFLFILFSNLLGLIPGFYPPTMNINTNAGIAAFVFLSYNYFGFRTHGISYLKQFLGPIPLLAFLFLPVEMVSHIFRPVSLSIRLFGNIFGDHTALETFTSLVPIFVPALFMVLGLIVSIVQAFVFALLSGIYIALAVSHEH